MLELADWHVLFNRAPRAIRVYREAWDLLESYPDLLERAFAEPHMIHMSVTRSWTDPKRFESGKIKLGVVELALHISDLGEVIGRKTVHMAPNDKMEYRVRVIAERAKYRPAFKDREPVHARNVPFIYNYAVRDRDRLRLIATSRSAQSS